MSERRMGTAAERRAGLSDRELAMLAFEKQWWKYAGVKEEAIRELFAVAPTRYYQQLNAVIDKQEALRAEPVLIKRLRRVRSTRQRARSARRWENDEVKA